MILPLLIAGTTSSGKTALSYFLADHIANVDILVVDSKQVYKDQDIVTGKDIKEKNTDERHSYYIHNQSRIFGLDLVRPDEEWSVGQFLRYAKSVIETAQKEERLLVILAGTPQFALSLFDSPASAHIPRNEKLREELDVLSVPELQKRMNPERLEKMNHSDSQNPRRLIRAIEIDQSSSTLKKEPSLLSKENVVWIGLKVTEELLEKRIFQRVSDRVEDGAVDEYRHILTQYPDWTKEAKSAIGYAEIEQYLAEKISKKQLLEIWARHELQYAKRQLTWWKREDQINWFETDAIGFEQTILEYIKNCYTK